MSYHKSMTVEISRKGILAAIIEAGLAPEGTSNLRIDEIKTNNRIQTPTNQVDESGRRRGELYLRTISQTHQTKRN